jgi:cytochrome c551
MLSHPMTRARRLLLIAASLAATAGGVIACGEEEISSSLNPEQRHAAQIFAERCAGCHTLSVVGAEGSAVDVNSREYKDGPNFNQRHVDYEQALYAIRNGGFSSGPMPQNLAVGPQAEQVARFVSKYSGKK